MSKFNVGEKVQTIENPEVTENSKAVYNDIKGKHGEVVKVMPNDGFVVVRFDMLTKSRNVVLHVDNLETAKPTVADKKLTALKALGKTDKSIFNDYNVKQLLESMNFRLGYRYAARRVPSVDIDAKNAVIDYLKALVENEIENLKENGEAIRESRKEREKWYLIAKTMKANPSKKYDSVYNLWRNEGGRYSGGMTVRATVGETRKMKRILFGIIKDGNQWFLSGGATPYKTKTALEKDFVKVWNHAIIGIARIMDEGESLNAGLTFTQALDRYEKALDENLSLFADMSPLIHKWADFMQGIRNELTS